MTGKTPAETRHTEIMVRLGKLDTKIEERIIPAVDQVWTNKEDIQTLENNADNTKDNRGRLISYASFIISIVIAFFVGLRHFKIGG